MTASPGVVDASVGELIAGLRSGELSSVEITSAYLKQIRSEDHRWHTYITVAESQALAAAAEFDARRRSGEFSPPLGGIPVAVKDNIPTAAIRTTANSRLLENWVPIQSAAAIEAFQTGGGIVLGKTNLNEFGWALPSSEDLCPPPPNPFNPRFLAIGSSSGSGVAVATGLAPAALGTDGGGSARLPAGQLGLVALKPTHGRVAHTAAGRSTISEISPICHGVADAALLFAALTGRQTAPDLDSVVAGCRIGVPRRLIETASVESEVQAAFDAALQMLTRLGVDLVEVDLAGMAEARMANFIVLNAESHAQHAAALRTSPDQYGRSARVYHWMGAFLSAADYLNALAIRERVQHLLQSMLHEVRAIVTPVSPFVTAEAARRPEVHRAGLGAVFTSPFNLTGHPALAVPCGISHSTNLPMGIQFVGALGHDESLLQLGYAFEQAANVRLDWRCQSKE